MTTATPTVTTLRGNAQWKAQASFMAKEVPVVERERQALRGMVREMLHDGTTPDEILLFLTASVLHPSAGGSHGVRELISSATNVLTSPVTTPMKRMEAYVVELLAEVKGRRA